MSSSAKPNHQLKAEREFRVGDLSTPVRVRIYQRLSDGALVVEQSHFIKTSIQYLPYAVNEYSGNEAEAFNQLVTTVTNFYEEAVRRGYQASDSWLVPNSAFE